MRRKGMFLGFLLLLILASGVFDQPAEDCG